MQLIDKLVDVIVGLAAASSGSPSRRENSRVASGSVRRQSGWDVSVSQQNQVPNSAT